MVHADQSVPARVALTGAAGNIGYALAFRIAAGDLLGPHQPLILRLIDLAALQQKLTGLALELEDCAFPLLAGLECTLDLKLGFDNVDYALLPGAKPRQAGMERSDLLRVNGSIFAAQGQALNAHAARHVKVLVIGNPANTNTLIAASHAPDLAIRQFTCLTRLDHNRAVSQLARKTHAPVTDVHRMTVWGNHSPTQYPDISHCRVRGIPASTLVEQAWYEQTFIPTVQARAAEIIKARGASSAGSAAAAALAHMHHWLFDTPSDDWVSMAVAADGHYGIAPGVVYSFPVTCTNGAYTIVPDLAVSPFSRDRMALTDRELRQEREAVKDLLGPRSFPH